MSVRNGLLAVYDEDDMSTRYVQYVQVVIFFFVLSTTLLAVLSKLDLRYFDCLYNGDESFHFIVDLLTKHKNLIVDCYL